jgi:hypothetical protein
VQAPLLIQQHNVTDVSVLNIPSRTPFQIPVENFLFSAQSLVYNQYYLGNMDSTTKGNAQIFVTKTISHDRAMMRYERISKAQPYKKSILKGIKGL